MSRALAAGAVLAVFLLGALMWFVPSVRLHRETVDSTPSLQGKDVRSTVPVKAGSLACIAPLPLDPGVREVQLLLNAGARPAALDLSLSAPGYHGRAALRAVPPGGDTPAVARLDRAPTATGDGKLCVRNAGRRTVLLVGTTEAESLSTPETTVDGKPVANNDPAVTFLTGERRDIPSQASTIAGRAAGFTGALPAWLVWVLAALVFAGMPLATAAVILLASRPE